MSSPLASPTFLCIIDLDSHWLLLFAPARCCCWEVVVTAESELLLVCKLIKLLLLLLLALLTLTITVTITVSITITTTAITTTIIILSSQTSVLTLLAESRAIEPVIFYGRTRRRRLARDRGVVVREKCLEVGIVVGIGELL
ncbi:hypothetical protein HanRHA438_Chr02g0086601 [Helianthus annuus]|nr:hypothetical protein HanIR_Chr02g0087891 [Helianthus annuus]KAJ0940722.1 hypothetical protein HanRHA438_Chr02g0086601 [Helianthus annuus]